MLAKAHAFQKGKGRASAVPSSASDGASGSRRCAYCQRSGHGTTTCPQLLLLQKNQDKLPATSAGTKSQSLSKKPRAFATYGSVFCRDTGSSCTYPIVRTLEREGEPQNAVVVRLSATPSLAQAGSGW